VLQKPYSSAKFHACQLPQMTGSKLLVSPQSPFPARISTMWPDAGNAIGIYPIFANTSRKCKRNLTSQPHSKLDWFYWLNSFNSRAFALPSVDTHRARLLYEYFYS
jgi:hypothetical protein